MEIVRLGPGERAPDNSDRITINSLPNGRHGVSGVTVDRATRGAAVHMITENSMPSADEAEAAGIRWAMQQPIDVLFVERS